MLRTKQITLKELDSCKKNLLAFGSIDPGTIKKIWKKPDELDITDFGNLEYDWELPLYTKMFFRWKNAGHRATILFNGCDPSNQNRLASHFKTWPDDFREQVWFFMWFRDYGFNKIFDKLPKKPIEEYTKILDRNEIDFFFSLEIEIQQELVKEYDEYIYNLIYM